MNATNPSKQITQRLSVILKTDVLLGRLIWKEVNHENRCCQENDPG